MSCLGKMQAVREDLSANEKMIADLGKNKYNINTAVDLIVRSPQFREVRGRDFNINQ